MSRTERIGSLARRLRGIGPLKKGAVIAVAIAVVAGVFGYVTFFSSIPQSDLPGNSEYDFGTTIIQGPLFYTPTYNECSDDWRPDYGLTCQWQKFLFGDLPGTPADMVEISKGVAENLFVNLHDLPSQYWQNPEFYPGWSQTHLDNIYRTLDEDRSTPLGYGAYLFGQGITTRQGAGTKTFATFLHGGWGVTHWQGMVLSITLPQVAITARLDADGRPVPLLDDQGNPVEQDPAIAAAMNPRLTFENDPVYAAGSVGLVDPLREKERMVVLEPNYPNFRPGWSVRVSIDIDIDGLVPGTYFFLVWAHTPTKEVGRLYFQEYGYGYISSGFGTPIFEGLLVVV